MYLNTGDNCSALCLRVIGVMRSGLANFSIWRFVVAALKTSKNTPVIPLLPHWYIFLPDLLTDSPIFSIYLFIF